MFPLLLAYSLMVLAQTRGPDIIAVLHGAPAKSAALAAAPVLPASADICAEYEAAHFDAASDVFHCAGMLALLLLPLACVAAARAPSRGGAGPAARALLWGPPVYYLPAWVGHFGFQRDVPAVFSYGTTWAGWRAGEACAMRQLFAGRILSSPWQWAAAVALAAACVRLIAPDAFEGTRERRDRKVE